MRWAAYIALVTLGLSAGCANPRAAFPRAFTLPDDALAYENGLVWEYSFDRFGNWVGRRREPPPDYSHRCFAQVRSARQFFQYARFAPELPRVGRERYRELVARIDGQDARRRSPAPERIAVPGFANLYEFSSVHGDLIQEAGGGIWRSYVQRGNWRMVIPFSRGNQARTASAMMRSIDLNRPPIARLVRFPVITINHAVVVYGYEVHEGGVTFRVYDPNQPRAARPLFFDAETRRFYYVRTDFFPGGRVDVYEIFDDFFY